jgi:hypothetical protein
VDPAAATEFLDQHFTEIGSNSGGATLIVTPTLEVTGTVEGRPFTAGSLPDLTFSMDPTALRLSGDATVILAPTATTPVVVDEIAPRTFTVLSVSVPVDVARLAAGVVLPLALVVLLAGVWIGRPRRGDAADDFLVRHAARIVPVEAFTPGQTVVDVSDAESLRRVAERFDSLVLHHAGPDGQTLAVQDSDTTYRYVFPDGMSQRPVPPVRALSPVTRPMTRIA